ncbi:MAG: ABC transporter ATP-binding protein [Candidatus Thermoplasmatota archaeon]|nr:ABC transporter ATP-binding protein [Candidatus Thermoplasmatota archaeon]
MQKPLRMEISNVSVRYGSNLAISDVNLTILGGKITALLGPNGSGKTTLLKTMVGLTLPDSGNVEIQDIGPASDNIKMKEISGFVAETPLIYESLTPLEMFEFVGSVRGIRGARLEDRIYDLSEALGLIGNLNDITGSLSFGTKQKVAIISALIHDPDILIMDESMNGLDPSSSIAIRNILREMSGRGKIIVVSTHMLEVADSFCDEVIILKAGKVAESGNIADLKEYVKHARSVGDIFDHALSHVHISAVVPELEG